MQTAVTLVHKEAMPIAVHAVGSFARNFTTSYRLHIHSDGSLDVNDENMLIHSAGGMSTKIIRPSERSLIVESRTADYPMTRALLRRGAYFTKMQIPVFEKTPYFYFDSDIVWLAPVKNLKPAGAPSAFSTESWSWYYGVANDAAWIVDKVPRRVNSGFYYLGVDFPFARMESMLNKRHFDPELPDNTDQEIMAYLYRNMEYYHPDDLKRSRRGIIYNLTSDPAAALHFPGGMWKQHLDQLEKIKKDPLRNPIAVRYKNPIPISKSELFRMRTYMAICMCRIIQRPLNFLRQMRNLTIK